MRNLILLASLLIVTSGFTCSRNMPPLKVFTFRSKVNIIGGFYKGQSGTVISMLGSNMQCRMVYEIKLDDTLMVADNVRVCDSDLEENL